MEKTGEKSENKNGSRIEIYTDGAYSSSRDRGGVGIVIIKNGEQLYEWSKGFIKTTNNRCELYGVIKALHCISKPVTDLIIYSDSQYVIYSITKGWKRKKNQDLWELFDKVLFKATTLCANIEFKWVKGHDSNKFNNRADVLAVNATIDLCEDLKEL